MPKRKPTDFEQDLAERLKDPEFKKYFDMYGKQFDIAYQLLQLRKKQKLSQRELAKKIGTTQSNIARMETGNQNFSTQTLVKLANVFNKQLVVEFR